MISRSQFYCTCAYVTATVLFVVSVYAADARSVCDS